MSNECVKEDTKRLLRKVYRMVDNDQCVAIESLNEGLNAMFENEMLNKTEAAHYLGIAVSTFNKYMAEGIIPPGTKKRNECIKWKMSVLKEVKSRIL